MIAKIVGFGETRDEARLQLAAGLARTIAFGIPTNQSFLSACLRNETFARGDVTTAFVARERDALTMDDDGHDALAALLLFVSDPHAARWQPGRSLAATFAAAMRLTRDGGTPLDVDVVRERDGSYVVQAGATEAHFQIDHLDGSTLRYHGADGVTRRLHYCRDADRLHLLDRGIVASFRDLTRAAPDVAGAEGGDGRVRAAMNGRVVAVHVKAGDSVSVGQPVLTLEAMKMEHVHAARAAGRVSALHAAEGDQVTTGMVLVEIGVG